MMITTLPFHIHWSHVVHLQTRWLTSWLYQVVYNTHICKQRSFLYYAMKKEFWIKKEAVFTLITTKRLVARVQKKGVFFLSRFVFLLLPYLTKADFKNYRKTYRKGEIWCWATLSCIYDVLSLHFGQKLCDLETTDEKVTNYSILKPEEKFRM